MPGFLYLGCSAHGLISVGPIFNNFVDYQQKTLAPWVPPTKQSRWLTQIHPVYGIHHIWCVPCEACQICTCAMCLKCSCQRLCRESCMNELISIKRVASVRQATLCWYIFCRSSATCVWSSLKPQAAWCSNLAQDTLAKEICQVCSSRIWFRQPLTITPRSFAVLLMSLRIDMSSNYWRPVSKQRETSIDKFTKYSHDKHSPNQPRSIQTCPHSIEQQNTCNDWLWFQENRHPTHTGEAHVQQMFATMLALTSSPSHHTIIFQVQDIITPKNYPGLHARPRAETYLLIPAES